MSTKTIDRLQIIANRLLDPLNVYDAQEAVKQASEGKTIYTSQLNVPQTILLIDILTSPLFNCHHAGCSGRCSLEPRTLKGL